VAKSAKVKKQQTSSPARGRKGGRKAAAAGQVGKKKKQKAGGAKKRLGRAQAAKPSKGGKAAARPSGGNRVMKFMREVRLEMSKVTWPTRDELVQATMAVLIAVAISGAFIFLFDVIFNRLVGLAS
jgi:preprotein translocase subunit SecE